ncbi:unnamed protein product [Pleuronectes platessa]|uniref:Uncharacterized protein n=1 Tax=Pleuronectes platessa TaxID=8262 RepID=A0A9N7UKQ6_PLEPL|nr:unnamed protein product [Pleuronectes platessa]
MEADFTLGAIDFERKRGEKEKKMEQRNQRNIVCWDPPKRVQNELCHWMCPCRPYEPELNRFSDDWF